MNRRLAQLILHRRSPGVQMYLLCLRPAEAPSGALCLARRRENPA